MEKPSEEEARRMLDEGGYAWNGGMFVWTWESFHTEMEKHAPEILSIATEIAKTGDWSRYEAMPSISIDYALMEKASDVFTVTGELGWSDLGSWDVIANTIDADESNVSLVDSERVFVKREGAKRLAVVGLEDVAIIETDEGMLVVNLKRTDAMRKL